MFGPSVEMPLGACQCCDHAFYLGKELAKASLAVSLGKTYRQEGTLSWGYLTPAEERSRHVRLTHAERKRTSRADR